MSDYMQIWNERKKGLEAGITARELGYKTKNGSDALLNVLRNNGVFPYTDLNRASVV